MHRGLQNGVHGFGMCFTSHGATLRKLKPWPYVCVKITYEARPSSPNHFRSINLRKTETPCMFKVGGFMDIFGRLGKSPRKQAVAPQVWPKMCWVVDKNWVWKAPNGWALGIAVILSIHSPPTDIQRTSYGLQNVANSIHLARCSWGRWDPVTPSLQACEHVL